MFPAEIAGIGHFERKGVPTAVWAGVPLSDPLAQLQRRVERACRRVGLTLEKRVYRPHITLARLRRTAAPVGDWLAKHGTLRAGPWEVELASRCSKATCDPKGRLQCHWSITSSDATNRRSAPAHPVA